MQQCNRIKRPLIVVFLKAAIGQEQKFTSEEIVYRNQLIADIVMGFKEDRSVHLRWADRVGD
ncbi:MAG: hypothetical protein B6D73_04005 [gamma proteobacterium symbiont of Stewartia floridana]|nr:MAG: hypothetical protein B6D73_04005 [gamma proteobacterium symbiont of Stewartia floridana]